MHSLAFRFWKDHKRVVDLLISCTNSFYVNKEDKEYLLKEGSMERNHLRYLMQKDPEFLRIKDRNVNIYFQLFLYAFGLFQDTLEHI